MNDSHGSKHNVIAETLLSDPLDFPDGKGFVSAGLRMNPLQMIEACEPYLQILNACPDFRERKSVDAPVVPFELK